MFLIEVDKQNKNIHLAFSDLSKNLNETIKK